MKILFETGCGKYFAGYKNDNATRKELKFVSDKDSAHQFNIWDRIGVVFYFYPELESYKNTLEFQYLE